MLPRDRTAVACADRLLLRIFTSSVTEISGIFFRQAPAGFRRGFFVSRPADPHASGRIKMMALRLSTIPKDHFETLSTMERSQMLSNIVCLKLARRLSQMENRSYY